MSCLPGIARPYPSRPEHLHHFVAQVIDHLHGDAAACAETSLGKRTGSIDKPDPSRRRAERVARRKAPAALARWCLLRALRIAVTQCLVAVKNVDAIRNSIDQTVSIGISTSSKLPGVAAATAAAISGSLFLISRHRPLPSTTIAILRPVRFC